VLWGSFDARDEAVTAWLAADRRKPLIHDDRSLLVGWMMELSRHADALPHLDLLIAERPDALEHRTRKMVALFRTGRGGQALAWCEATKKLLVEQKRWERSRPRRWRRRASSAVSSSRPPRSTARRSRCASATPGGAAARTARSRSTGATSAGR
jgi:hypothetical protein